MLNYIRLCQTCVRPLSDLYQTRLNYVKSISDCVRLCQTVSDCVRLMSDLCQIYVRLALNLCQTCVRLCLTMPGYIRYKFN